MVALPHGAPLPLHSVQHDFGKSPSSPKSNKILEARREKVKQAFLKSWNSYKKLAWKYDELGPLSGEGKNTFGGLAATIMDALDTLWIMDLKDDFYEAVNAVAVIDFMKTEDKALNLFETTIRYLGGLLSAYDLSGEQVLLRKAVELGEMLYAAFDTPNRLPGFWLNFADAQAGNQLAGTGDPSASPCSLGLEFTRLSQLTGDDKYYDAINRVTDLLETYQNRTALPGMWPTLINFRHETMPSTQFTLGALADSLYEYLPKMYALLGGLEPKYERLYRGAAEAVTEHLLFRPMLPPAVGAQDVLFSGTVEVETNEKGQANTVLDPESQHLTCFAGGMFGLGGKLFRKDRDVNIGERLTRGCTWGYSQMPTGLLPEIFGMVPCPSIDEDCKWDEQRWVSGGGHTNHDGNAQALPGGFRHARDPRYILRPEAVESAFLLYRMTGKAEFQESAWTMFESITKATETKLAYASIADVTSKPNNLQRLDSMEVSATPCVPAPTKLT